MRLSKHHQYYSLTKILANWLRSFSGRASLAVSIMKFVFKRDSEIVAERREDFNACFELYKICKLVSG